MFLVVVYLLHVFRFHNIYKKKVTTIFNQNTLYNSSYSARGLKNPKILTVKHNKTVYNLNYFQKKYFSLSHILLTNNNESSYTSQQPEENNTSQQPEENNTSQQPEENNTYGPKTFLDSEKDKLAEEEVKLQEQGARLDRVISVIAEEADKAGLNRMDVTSRIDAIKDDLRDSGNLSPTTLDLLDKNKDKYDRLDQKTNELIEKEEGTDSVEYAYYTRFKNEIIANRQLNDVNNLLGDRNVQREDREYLSELEVRMKNCKKDDIRVSEFDKEFIKEYDDYTMRSDELDSKRRALEGSSEEEMYYSSSEEKMYSSLLPPSGGSGSSHQGGGRNSDEKMYSFSDENRAPTTEESSKVDKSKSTEEESSSVDKGKATEEGSSSVDKGKATEEGSTKEDKGKRKATEEEAYEGETKRSRVDASSLLPPSGGSGSSHQGGGRNSDENKGSLIDQFADVSTEMPSYMDPDDG